MAKGEEERERLLEERARLMRRIEEIDRRLNSLAGEPLPHPPAFRGRVRLGAILDGSYDFEAQPLWALWGCLKGCMEREGTLRVLDERGEVCAFFLGSPTGQVVLLTQSFLCYLSKNLERMRELRDMHRARVEGSSPAGERALAPELAEMAELKGWLMSIMDSLATFHLRSLMSLNGAIPSSTLSSLDQRFALEESTKRFFSPRALRRLLGLMNMGLAEFLEPAGPLREIEGYLDDYLEYSRKLGVRRRLLLLLEQLGCPEAQVFSSAGKPAGPKGAPVDVSLFLPEALLEQEVSLEERPGGFRRGPSDG